MAPILTMAPPNRVGKLVPVANALTVALVNLSVAMFWSTLRTPLLAKICL